MGYYINSDTKSEILYHGSKRGIEGAIIPKSENATDFGNGFYMGTKEIQTLARVSNEPNPKEYQFKISDKYINEQNTLCLSIDDWVYFVLYNRGKLEDLQETCFYEKYSHLADGKDFIIGPIADDVYDLCITHFSKGLITDWTFKQLIDCFDYGLQVVAKSQRACSVLEKTLEKSLSKEDRNEIKAKRIVTRKERVTYYEKKVAELNAERKGRFLNEIKAEIQTKEATQFAMKDSRRSNERVESIIDECSAQIEKFKNIKFPDKIHERKDVECELFK